ncbi:hypothetical protein [Rhizobium sp. LjRoot254]|uniref:hypothetical protein n=1 Tax=Rhizobium sp. LjRoot254 TaxID=3342297 RepID=UPI003ECD274F
MTIRSGLVVLMRAAAILLAFQVAIYIIGVIALPGTATEAKFAQIAALSLLFAPCLVILLFAEPMVNLLTPKSSELLAETETKPDDLQAIILSGVGVYVLYYAIRDTIFLLVAHQQLDQFTTSMWLTADYYLLPLIGWPLGLYLLIGAPALRRLLGRLRRASPPLD